jgi:hypothetical protein
VDGGAVILATCSYSAYRQEMGTPVRITLGIPRWPDPPGRQHWIFVSELAPRWAYFHAEPDVFERRYRAQLERHQTDILDKLAWLAGRFGPLTLCCFERHVSWPADCHRRIAAMWLQDRLGVEVPELDPREEKRS